MNLFETEQSRRMNALEKAVDSIRDKYGVDSIKRASFLEKDRVVDHTVSKKKHLKQKGEPYQPRDRYLLTLHPQNPNQSFF